MTYERRAIARNAGYNVRADGDDLYIEGYFSVFGSEYVLWDDAVEMIDQHAFDDTLNDDVRALCDHDTRLVLGRTTAGTLTLRVDQKGLWGSIRVNRADTDAMNLYARVSRKDVTQCSFGFDILSEKHEYRPDGKTVWTILKVKLYEVSVVTFPAYEDTEVNARKDQAQNAQKRKRELWQDAMLAKIKK